MATRRKGVAADYVESLRADIVRTRKEIGMVGDRLKMITLKFEDRESVTVFDVTNNEPETDVEKKLRQALIDVFEENYERYKDEYKKAIGKQYDD